jgi:hypothetical protein
MTPAERMRHYRQRKKKARPKPSSRNEVLAAMTIKQRAALVGVSVRYWHYMKTFGENTLIKWDGDVMNGKYGKVGMAFLAEVCTNAPQDVQQAINDCIKARGAAAGRALWRDMVRVVNTPRVVELFVGHVLGLLVRERRNNISAQAIADHIDDPSFSLEVVVEALDLLRASGDYDRIIAKASR